MRKFLSTIFDLKHILLTIAVIVSIFVLIVDWIVPISNELLWKVLIFLLGTIAAGLLIERVIYFEPTLEAIKSFPKNKVVAINAFYPNRDVLPQFADVVKPARREIFWTGNIGGTFVDRFRGVLESKLKEGCQVKILMMCPEINQQPNPLLPLFGYITHNVNAESRLMWTIATLREWHENLSQRDPEVAKRLEVRAYDTLMTMVIMFIDADTPDGLINVELIPHRFLASERPSFDLNGKNGEELYSRLYMRYKELWDNSKSILETKKE